MVARRFAALVASLFAICAALAAPAWASGEATYPPAVEGSGSGVSGVGTGVEATTGGSQSGLAHTGFAIGIAAVAVALLVLGATLLVVSRRRSHA